MAIRVAVLGCGYWGANHIRTLKALGVLCAVSDANADRAIGFASEHGVPALTPEELIATDTIDAVVVALPPQFHAQMAIRLVEKGKDVMIEKPIALTVPDAEAALDAARKNNRIFMTGHVLRFHPAFERLEKLADDGDLGEIRYIHSHRLGLGKFHTENDALWDLAPHDLSMMLALAKSEPLDVHGEGAAILDHLSDFAHLHLRFENGVRGHLFASRLNPYRERRLTVVGTKGMAVFDDTAKADEKLQLYRHKIWRDDDHWSYTMDDPAFVECENGMPLTRELEHFIHCVETRETPRTDGSEAVAVLKILTAGTVRHGQR